MIQRLGINTGISSGKNGKKRVWIHALSVGEVRSAIPLVEILKQKWSGWEIIFTATTKTGFDTAKEVFLKDEHHLIDLLGYFPFDLIFSVKRLVSLISPDLVLIVESDLWPNFIGYLDRQNIPICLVNARMSKRSYTGYRFFKFFFYGIFSRFSGIFVQTDIDARRFMNLGISENKIMVAGNIKFDQKISTQDRSSLWKKLFNLSEKSQVVLAGSTHTGEEEILADFYDSTKKIHPRLVMVIAPRDPERAETIAEYFLHRGMQVSLLSRVQAGDAPEDVILVDRIGVLAEIYIIAHVAFVGGSLVPSGGHNPLEAACFAKPILFGPYMDDFSRVAEMLIQAKGAFTVRDTRDLCHLVHTILSDNSVGDEMGRRSFEIFCSNSGAALRIVGKLKDFK